MKLKPTLQKRLDAEQKQRKRYRRQYGIENENVVVVEKRNTIKLLAEVIRQLLRWISIVVIAFLALSGLYAWVCFHHELSQRLQAAIQEIQTFING